MRKVNLLTLAALLLMAWTAVAHTFTDTKGRKLEGEISSATADQVVIKRKLDGRTFTIKIDILSEADKDFITEFKAKQQSTKAVADAKKVRDEAVKKIVAYSEASMGKQIGNGECWTLANEAYKNALIERPGSDMRVWGREIDYKKEDPKPGDILEVEKAAFASGFTVPEKHTAVIVTVGKRGVVTVCEQNIGGDKRVQHGDYDLNGIKSGIVKIFRYEGAASEMSNANRFELD